MGNVHKILFVSQIECVKIDVWTVAKQGGTPILRTGYKKYECDIDEAIDITNAFRGKNICSVHVWFAKTLQKKFHF